jgi:hypothetical protein
MRDIMVPTADIDNAKILMDYDNPLRGPRNLSRSLIKVLLMQDENSWRSASARLNSPMPMEGVHR